MMSVSKTCYQGDGCGLLLSMISATVPYLKVTVYFSVLCKYPDPKGFMCEDVCVCLCVCPCVWRPEPAIKCLPKYCGRIWLKHGLSTSANPIQLAWVCVPGLFLSSPQTLGLQAGTHAESVLVLGSWTLVSGLQGKCSACLAISPAFI